LHLSAGHSFALGAGGFNRAVGTSTTGASEKAMAAELLKIKELRDQVAVGDASAEFGNTRTEGTSGRAIGAGGAAVVAAVAGMAVRFARSFAAALPRRGVSTRGTAEKPKHSGCAGGFVAPASAGASVSSSSSGFLGSSMAGSVTAAVQTPRPQSGGSALSSMKMMFEKFNEKAIKAVMLSQEEARRLGQPHVSTEMILGGIVGEGTSFGAKTLKKNYGVDLRAVRAALDKVYGSNRGSQQSGEVPFTQEAKGALKTGIEEAKKLNSQPIEPSHILLAILKGGEPGVKALLEELKVDAQQAVAEISKELGEQLTKEVEARGGAGQAEPKKPGNVLDEFGRDLTQIAADGLTDPLVGRAEEIERTIQILARRQKNNPVLIGEPGVGKTAIAEGLAQRIATGDVPDIIQGKRIILLDLGSLLSGTKFRGEFEERLNNIIKECVASEGKIILMIDEIHTIVGAGGGGDGGGGGAMDAANIMKPALSRGDLQVIGATTIEEYRKHVEKDKALERRFQPVQVPEPTVDETIKILKGLARKYEAHHRLRYTDEALESCVKFASQYIQDRFLPDKAIDVMDEAGARVQLRQLAKIPDNARQYVTELRDIQEQKEDAVRKQEYNLAGELLQKESALQDKVRQAMREELAVAEAAGETAPTSDAEEWGNEPLVTENDVAGVVAAWTGVPVSKVTADESARLVALEDTLHNRVIGQEEAVVAVSKAVRRARAGLKNPNRPIASFIFCGPTGVGKTELCKALAAAYFGKEDAMIRLDMSEFMEKHTVSKLIGSPPGYVGYDEESQLTDGVRRRPYTLVLFDEVEKAHPDVFNLLLQVLEDGRLTDSKGRTVSFKNTLIIMTSNCGAKEIEKELLGGGNLGFSGTDDDTGKSNYQRLKGLVHEQLKGFFRPEFINRLDEVIVFKSLTKPEVSEIAELEFRKTFKRCQEKGVTLSLTDRFKKKVVDEGFNPIYGARPLRRAVMRLLEDSLAESFLNQTPLENECVICDLDKEGKVVVLRQILDDKSAPEALPAGEDIKVTEEQPVTAGRA